jgi:uncharacterized protein YggE
MNDGGGPLLSVRAEARQLVAPDYAVVDGPIEHTAGSKAEAVRSVADSLDRLTADLAALGAVPFDASAGRRPLTWSAHSWTAWPQVRAAAIRAAIGKARDYAAALGATVHHVEHIADAGLLGSDTAPYHTVHSMAFSASGGGDQPGTLALTPVPQELTATIEARFRTTDVSLPDA